MKKGILGLVLVFGFALNAHSQGTSSLGFTYLSDHRGLDLGAVVGSLGYRIEGGGGWSFQTEIRAGLGVVDDSIRGFSPVPPAPMVDVELDNLLGVAARIQYQTNASVYLFAQPTLTRVELDPDYDPGIRALNEADWEIGGDVGAGYMFGERFGVEGSYGIIDGESVLNAALRIYF